MSQDYIQKIRNLLNESNQIVPFIFERFYTLLKLITLQISHQKNDQKIFEQYSLIFRTIKRYLVDELELIINKRQKIEKQLNLLINPLLVLLKEDSLSKKIYEYFFDKQINLNITAFIKEADNIKKQLLQKKIKIKVFGTHEMGNSFWLRKFKNQYAVHVDIFWNCFLEFINQIDFYKYFVSPSSKKSIIKKVDPDKKYFVTSSNVNQLFYKLSEPKYLEQLADQTAKGNKPLSFQSRDFLELKFFSMPGSFFQTKLKQGNSFEINGDDTQIQGEKTKIRNPPTIIFGSSIDSDIKIKNQYVSRKQFMIIEQDEKSLPNQSVYLPFSLVCLSSSNFTMVSYNRVEKLKAGMIFKVGQDAIQVVKICDRLKDNTKQEQISDSDKDQTLEYLPLKITTLQQKELEYLCISGPCKGKKGKVSKQCLELSMQFPNTKTVFQYQENEKEFYLPNGTKIFVKTANQVINGQLSDKIFIQQGMKILLEECWFQVE